MLGVGVTHRKLEVLKYVVKSPTVPEVRNGEDEALILMQTRCSDRSSFLHPSTLCLDLIMFYEAVLLSDFTIELTVQRC